MGQKKNSKIILIIIILLVVLILATGFAYTYFATDIFKSNKELFFKYMTQIADKENGIIDRQLKEYFEKQKNTPYTNQGTFSFDMDKNENINDFNISFSGQTDKSKSSAIQDISINYSDEVNFPISYKKIEDTIGLQTKFVSSKYIAVETDNMEDKNFEGVTEIVALINQIEELGKSIPQENRANNENSENIYEKYINVVMNQLQDSQFSKIEENNYKGYKLNLNNEQIKNILVQLLETLKNDQSTLDKINEQYSSRITSNTIDNNIKDIERKFNSDDENYEISVYQKNGKIAKIVILAQEIEIQLEKSKAENTLKYVISAKTEDNDLISISANYSGLESMQNVDESYEISFQTKENYKYQFNNQITFTDRVNIEEFSEDNSMILNDYDEEQVNNFLKQVEERIEMVNKEQMDELEMSENPLSLIFMPIMQNQIIGINNTVSDMQEQEVNTFNAKFENYESTNLQGVTVKGLLTIIEQNNEIAKDENRKIKEIHFDGQEYEVTDQNIILIKSSIETETAYRVEFEKDEITGLIYRAVINKK